MLCTSVTDAVYRPIDIGVVSAGFVISLLGFALAYAQLVPVPCKTTRQAYDLREAQATDIQKQVLLC